MRTAFNPAGCCCEVCESICVTVWSTTEYCIDATDGSDPPVDCTGGNIPGGMAGVTVTINLVDPDDDSETLFESGTTDAEGQFCTEASPDAGKYRIHVEAGDCAEQTTDIVLATPDPSPTCSVTFAFCCWTYSLTVQDADDHSGLSPDFNCSNGMACDADLHIEGTGISSQPSGICASGMSPCPDGPDPDISCDIDTGWVLPDTFCTLTLEGYWPRCISFPTRCDVPIYDNVDFFEMYSTVNWILNPCCGNCTVTDTRPPEMIPKQLFITLTGPVQVIGDTSRLYTMTYDDTLSDYPTTLVWKSECIETPGSWGVCLSVDNNQCGIQTMIPIADPETGEIIYTPTCFPPTYIGVNLIVAEVPYQSQRVYLIQETDPACRTRIVLKNFWGGGCPVDSIEPTDVDSPPECGYTDPETGTQVHAKPWAKLCGQLCPCGIIGSFDPDDIASSVMVTQYAVISCTDPYGTGIDCLLCAVIDTSGCGLIGVIGAAGESCPQPVICAELTE